MNNILFLSSDFSTSFTVRSNIFVFFHDTVCSMIVKAARISTLLVFALGILNTDSLRNYQMETNCSKL